MKIFKDVKIKEWRELTIKGKAKKSLYVFLKKIEKEIPRGPIKCKTKTFEDLLKDSLDVFDDTDKETPIAILTGLDFSPLTLSLFNDYVLNRKQITNSQFLH